MAKRAEAEQGVRGADFERHTRSELLAKDKELLASLQAQKPGLEAIMLNARDYLDRFNRLARTGDIPVQDRDNREATYREAVSKLKSLESNIAAAERQVLASELQFEEADTKLEQSRKALANTHSIVGRADAAQLEPQVEEQYGHRPGKQGTASGGETQAGAAFPEQHPHPCADTRGSSAAGRSSLDRPWKLRKPFLSIVPLDLDNVWVVANLREEQMARVRVGQRAQLRVDGIPERDFRRLGRERGGRNRIVFSLFPPDNATGNFVRVVQRLPVRVRFQEPTNYQNRIRPGMSAQIVIDTRIFVRQSDHHW